MIIMLEVLLVSLSEMLQQASKACSFRPHLGKHAALFQDCNHSANYRSNGLSACAHTSPDEQKIPRLMYLVILQSQGSWTRGSLEHRSATEVMFLDNWCVLTAEKYQAECKAAHLHVAALQQLSAQHCTWL